jgi:hypothetical protein
MLHIYLKKKMYAIIIAGYAANLMEKTNCI